MLPFVENYQGLYEETQEQTILLLSSVTELVLKNFQAALNLQSEDKTRKDITIISISHISAYEREKVLPNMKIIR